MAKQKKFGTFGGVFTPSILTILGVIMYLRLPLIVGQAGLFATLGILFLAHLISVTTGLSVSSIATDKKVKAGGTYYMISRSLGLPIGGTLGLALFVGLSFSVSLYLIGFAESFLSFWGYEVTKDTIRLTGSIMLVSVTIITFISTSLAIKTQYFIMTAIILSLLSILFGSHQFTPSEPLLTPLTDAAPFIILFGIFFPAVTGFEAGVSMSGDLQDPKKSIPSGTIAAIVIGLIVYIALAFFFTYTVSPEVLVNDPNVLLNISLVPELVIAGIWGATLSSAFGSILGAPRILQATSKDKITHRFFSKGYGELNEPRNALFLTFIIAEAGILIGELDVIARIVSMFFITTYGFLNLSSAIESWASSDFRPDFRIPKFVSIIGSMACFIVMIQLDFIAMVGATILLGALFLYLKRKELILEGGDAWGSVWSSIVRKGLGRLSVQKTEIRNWRPNILLFSGMATARPHLIEIAKSISGRLGIVSNFNLIENSQSENLFKEESFSEDLPVKSEGVFTRSYKCKDLYQGIDVISRVYGFSGVEPNTVIMGWGRNTKDPHQFTKLVKNFNELDLNSIYVDLDKEREFGEKKNIDVWWRGAGNNLSFVLSVIRYLTSNSEWRDANVRFLIISQNSSVIAKAYRNLNQILEQYRVHGEIKIINNEIERKKPIEIIIAESSEADLTIFGIPEVTESTAVKYIDMINELTLELGTTLLVNASSTFKDIDIGIIREVKQAEEKFETASSTPLLEIKAASNIQLENEVKHIQSKLISLYDNFNKNTLNDLKNILSGSAEKSKIKSVNFFEYLSNRSRQLNPKEKVKLLNKVKSGFIDFLMTEIVKLEKLIEENNGLISDGLDDLSSKLKESVIAVPENLTISYNRDDLNFVKGETLFEKINKKLLNYKFGKEKTSVTMSVNFEGYTDYYLSKIYSENFTGYLKTFEQSGYKLLSELHNIYNSFIFALDSAASKAESDTFFDVIKDENELVKNSISSAAVLFNEEIESKYQSLVSGINSNLQSMVNDIENINAGKLLKHKRKISASEKLSIDASANYADVLKENLNSLISTLRSDLLVFDVKNGISDKSFYLKERIETEAERSYLRDLLKLEKDAEEQIKNAEEGLKVKLDIEYAKEFALKAEFTKFFEDCRSLLLEVPEHIQIIGEDFSEKIESGLFEKGGTSEITLRKLVEFYFESEFIGKLQSKADEIQKEFDRAHSEIEDSINLTNFNLQNFESDMLSDLPKEKQVISMLDGALQKFREEYKKIEGIVDETKVLIDQYLNSAFEPLKSYRIIKTLNELGSHVREREGKQVVTSITSTKNRFNVWFQNILVKLFYKRSEGILFARKVAEERDESVNVSDFYKLTESLTPNDELMNKIPYYYKKLFSGRASVSKEFWVGRDKELAECSKAVKLFSAGQSGGLLIIGERNVGKSSLSKHTAELHFKFNRIYDVTPPASGSIKTEIFDETLSRVIGTELPLEEFLRSSAGEAVIIFNDIELWWERSEDGLIVLNRMFNLTSSANKNWFFIFNMNINSFEFIRKIKAIDQNFLSVVKCGAFDAEELKEIILRRHDASGMDLTLNGIPEDQLTQLKLARYFNSLFDYSKGNIGAALNGWINSIENISGNTINVVNPDQNDLSILKSLPDDWIILIIQILLHRQLDLERLSKIFYDDPVFLNETIDKLKRAKIIRQFDRNVIEINPYIEPYLVEFLNKRGLV